MSVDWYCNHVWIRTAAGAHLGSTTRIEKIMKAAIYRKYGPPEVLGIENVARPTPKDDEVLVRVRASSVTSGDVPMRGFRDAGVFWLPMRLMLGLFGPRNPIAGQEFAGQVESVGQAVTRFRVGEAVFGMTWLHGANAEYAVVPADALITIKPEMLTDAQAASVPFGALSALAFLRDLGGVQRGQKILVYGASGCVGVFAVQLAKHLGAAVTGVCSTANVDLVRSLGADRVIDYTREDFTGTGETYDVIFDTVGVTAFTRCRRALKPNGVHLFLSGGLLQILQSLWTSMRPGKRVVFGVPHSSCEDLMYIRNLIEAGAIRPVIDRTYHLHEIVDAHRYVDTGRKKGSVVIEVAGQARP
jgi:NADPH:quinone reductase-like Zn-dependent oxidoreductase